MRDVFYLYREKKYCHQKLITIKNQLKRVMWLIGNDDKKICSGENVIKGFLISDCCVSRNLKLSGIYEIS